jgi:hypothetical protein
MANAPIVISGARAMVSIAQGDAFTPIGIYSDVSYSYNIDQQPVYILGRYSAASIDPVALEVCSISATGWRVLDHGPFAVEGGNFTKLQNLVDAGYLTFRIFDRQLRNGKPTMMAEITKVRPTSAGGGFSMRQLSSVSYGYVGILMSDETADNSEAPGAMDLPGA